MAATHLNDTNFQAETSGSSLPVVVDFWAPWCGPCRAMSPVVDEVADELDGQALVVKVNVDEANSTAAKFGITSIPAFAVLQDGEVKNMVAGAMPKERLLANITPHLN